MHACTNVKRAIHTCLRESKHARTHVSTHTRDKHNTLIDTLPVTHVTHTCICTHAHGEDEGQHGVYEGQQRLEDGIILEEQWSTGPHARNVTLGAQGNQCFEGSYSHEGYYVP